VSRGRYQWTDLTPALFQEAFRADFVCWFILFDRYWGIVMPVARLNLLPEKVSRFSQLSSEFEFWGSFPINVEVNPVFSWKGQNSFQRIFPPYSQHFTTPQIFFEFSGFYYTSNSFLIKPIKTNDRKTCPFREILSQRIGRGDSWSLSHLGYLYPSRGPLLW